MLRGVTEINWTPHWAVSGWFESEDRLKVRMDWLLFHPIKTPQLSKDGLVLLFDINWCCHLIHCIIQMSDLKTQSEPNSHKVNDVRLQTVHFLYEADLFLILRSIHIFLTRPCPIPPTSMVQILLTCKQTNRRGWKHNLLNRRSKPDCTKPHF